MRTLRTTAACIDALGGNPAVAKLIDSNVKAVWNWRTYGKFPAHSYVVLQKELSKKGFKAPDDLWAMSAKAT